jgi:hypothetical protein
MQNEALGLDGFRTPVYPSGDMHFEAGLTRGARHRQSIKQEREILVRDVEQASRCLGRHSTLAFKVAEVSSGGDASIE